ncbi:MAG: hypothetical protein NZ869_04340 [Thermoanaerobaculum sp.]|nr:hypothetical protein [Thermoanaerobaculum sp.]MDW7967100.1 hypothetical protein [Thermoanaerobaculum sp.]
MRKLVLVLLVGLWGSVAWANFRASNFVIVPAAAAAPGLQGATWRTDLEIMNVDEVPVDVLIVFLPTGNLNNTYYYDNFSRHLGGRSEDGFSKVDSKLKDIQPGRSVVLENIIEGHWGANAVGALLIWAYKAGSFKQTTPPGGEPRKILVWSRTYNRRVADDGTVSTYGQGIPGIPWYYYINPSKQAQGLNKVVFSGIREDAAFRTNVGLVNISDRLTSLEVQLTLYGPDGAMLKDVGVVLNPLAHEQFDQAVKTGLFQLQNDLTFGTLQISVKLWRSTAAQPTPALLAYVSRVDNVTNDAVYLEQTFTKPFPWECVFEGRCTNPLSLAVEWTPWGPLPPPTP